METTKNKMPVFAENFFKKLGNYLDTKIYFFGSVQRFDYFPNSSDIDVDVFTDNEKSTIYKLQHFLNLKRAEFKKFIYRLHKTKKVVHGYKVKYKDEANNFVTEISIYNEQNKAQVLEEHLAKTTLPFYISALLFILKFFYYNLPLLPKSVYMFFKKLIMNYMVEGEDVEFVMTDIPEQKEEKVL
jgi:predicted nucleotidyltransferase